MWKISHRSHQCIYDSRVYISCLLKHRTLFTGVVSHCLIYRSRHAGNRCIFFTVLYVQYNSRNALVYFFFCFFFCQTKYFLNALSLWPMIKIKWTDLKRKYYCTCFGLRYFWRRRRSFIQELNMKAQRLNVCVQPGTVSLRLAALFVPLCHVWRVLVVGLRMLPRHKGWLCAARYEVPEIAPAFNSSL